MPSEFRKIFIIIIFCFILFYFFYIYRQTRKNFRNVDWVLASHNKVQDTQANLKTIKRIFVAVCGLVFSRLIGYFLSTQ